MAKKIQLVYNQCLDIVISDMDKLKNRKELAKFVGVSVQHLYNISKRGKDSNISPKVLFTLLEYFGYGVYVDKLPQTQGES
jgi:hypothetical protein